MWRCDNVGGLSEHVTCHLFCFIRRLAPSPHRWTDFDDLYVYDLFLRKDVSFWVTFILLRSWGSNPQNPYFWGVTA